MTPTELLQETAETLWRLGMHADANRIDDAIIMLAEQSQFRERAERAEASCRALLNALSQMNFDSNWPARIDQLEAAWEQATALAKENRPPRAGY